jgi:hypothetical protein
VLNISQDDVADDGKPGGATPAAVLRSGPAGPGTRRLVRTAILAGAVMAGGLNVLRTACWTPSDGFVCGPFAPASAPAADRHVAAVRGLTRLDAAAPGWRPLGIMLQARSIPGVPAGAIRAGTSGALDDAIPVQPDGPPVVLTTVASAHRLDRLSVWAEPSSRGTGAALEVVGVRPAPAVWPAVGPFAAGAGVFLALAWAARGGWVTGAAPRGGGARPSLSPRAAAALAGMLAVYAGWAVLRPPLQAPDEPHHHARATSIPSTPWTGGAREVSLVPAHRNPLTWTPNALHAIIGRPAERLSSADVETLRATGWTPSTPYQPVVRIPTPVASYPPAYYWMVFAGGEALTGLFDLSPLHSLLAYRLVSAAGAWILWAAALVALDRIPETRRHAIPIWLVLAGTPTVAAMSATVNPDAIVIPATVLLFIGAWRMLSAGHGRALALVGAALAIATKPVGFFGLAAVLASALIWAWQRPADRCRAARLGRDLGAIAAVAWFAFYAWSPSQLQPAAAPPDLSFREYAWSLIARAPGLWIELWGRLGWVEYAAAPWWYVAILAACAGSAAVALWRRHEVDSAFARHALVVALAYGALVVATEFVNHAEVGLFAQGRYFAPALFGLVPILCGAGRQARWLLCALLGCLHLALAGATLTRYFGADWALWSQLVRGQ